MQIKRQSGKLILERFGGSIVVGDARKNVYTKIATIDENIDARFNLSPDDTDPKAIPFAVYRNLTPDEQDELLQHLRAKQQEHLQNRLQKLIDELSSLTATIPGLKIEHDLRERLNIEVSAFRKALGVRRSSNVQQANVKPEESAGDSPGTVQAAVPSVSLDPVA